MKKNSLIKNILIGCSVAFIATSPAIAQNSKARPSALNTMGSNREPIKIDADKLDVFDKESKAIFEGNVIAVQGDSTMKCTKLTVFYDQNKTANGEKAEKSTIATPGQDQQIRKIDCAGPVTIVNKTQVATGNNAVFDRIANKVILTGNVTLSEGPNVTRGDRVVYNLNTQTANIENKPGGRVRALFVPGSQDEKP
ncbi:LptA/OstA family protein [Microvirga sp. W0021]|uniref:LptA/OstA family protein n=1 Tax=Hohaiivirga grylli TaxID=3133970 RepID=A0ABV0BFS1_9HYPH